MLTSQMIKERCQMCLQVVLAIPQRCWPSSGRAEDVESDFNPIDVTTYAWKRQYKSSIVLSFIVNPTFFFPHGTETCPQIARVSLLSYETLMRTRP